MSIDNLKNFDAWALEWLETYKKGIVKDNTYWGTYHNPVTKHLIPYFHDTKLYEIRPLDVQRFFKTLSKTHSLSTQNKIKAALNSIFITAIENNLCERNPVTSTLKLTSEVPPIEKYAYTKDEMETVWNFALNHPLGLSVMILLETGISRSELLGIDRLTDIDLERAVIHINNGTVQQKDSDTGKLKIVTKGLKTKYRRRVLPISKSLCQKIFLRICEIEEQEKTSKYPIYIKYLISSPRGKVYSPDNWYKRVYKKFMDDLKTQHPEIPFRHPHELRHSRASLWHDNGLDLLDIAYLGGWCDIEMLRKRYCHVNIDELRNRMNLPK